MTKAETRSSRWNWALLASCLVLAIGTIAASSGAQKASPPDLAADYANQVRPLLTQYCLRCHSQKEKKGDLDLERFTSLAEVRKDVRPWQAVLEMLETGEMPPKKNPQPKDQERQRLLVWVRGLLDAEARGRAGDPGRVIVRRLSNAEYNNTIRDLTGIELQPARDFPGDGAAGEGFTNAGDALVISPTLLYKYLGAAKSISAHAVLLPDGFRFSPSLTRRDWTDEALARLRACYADYPADGKLPLRPYLTAAIRHRDETVGRIGNPSHPDGRIGNPSYAERDHLNLKYCQILWQTLNDTEPSFPLEQIRARWRQAKPQDADAVLAEIAAWQAALWKVVPVGSYRYGNTVRQVANNSVAETQTVRLKLKPAPGQKEVVLYLAAREFPVGGAASRAAPSPGPARLAGPTQESHAVWHRPRFEGGKQAPLLLRNVPSISEQKIHLQGDNLVALATSVVEVRLPAALVQDREFVVECKLDPASAGGLTQFQVLTTPPPLTGPLGAQAAWVGSPGSETAKRLIKGFDGFRRCFPLFVCYPRVIPDDEVVCLKLYHREDEPLIRLFLDDAQTQRVDRLWSELRFISQYPVTEHKQLPLFIGFVTQDQPKELVAYFESQREPFRKRAEDFERDVAAAAPRQLEALLEFASRAYRRPLQEREKTELVQLYQTLRKKEMSHEEAFRTVLTRVLVSPSFLFRLEQAASGKEAQPISGWELATRLSYFLWATTPDEKLRQAAAEGRLQDPEGLSLQVKRMLQDPKMRGLATEFGTQWLHVRDIQQNREKNEKLFPTFDDQLRHALFEESVWFFQDLFQSDRPALAILDTDHTFLNETLAKHYGIPNVAGPQWRRVDGVKKYGRGGVLGLGSVLTKQSGASRTSPVLRGNWLVEVLLGEKLPRPPADVPRLPEEETGAGLTVRQLVEKHASVAQCAVCHQRIDPFGFALEAYDPIGRFRDKDLGGRPIDTRARLKDGTQFDGIDGLRRYLLTQRKEDFLRQFCKKLLGYALGRSVTLSDQPLVEEMREELKKNDYRVTAAVLTIVRSKQFRSHRGLEATKDE